MKKERSLDIFEISGKTAIGLLIIAVVVPPLAVPALFFTPIAACIWLLGECLPQEEPTKEVTLKK